MIATNIVDVVLSLAIMAALIQKYRLTRDQGFLWLGLPLVVMPLLSFPLRHSIDRLASGRGVGFFPYTFVERGEMSIGSLVALLGHVQHWVTLGLFFIAILMLCKAKPSQTLTKA